MIITIPHLNSLINNHPLYLLSLAALLNSYTNSFIVYFSYSNLFSSTTFAISLSSFPNSFLKSTKISSTILYSKFHVFRFSNTFSFQISANSLYTYNKIYYICFSTISSLILILKNSLYAVTNSEAFSELPLNTCGLVTSILTPMLGLGIAASASAFYTANSTCIYGFITASCFYCC